MTDKEKLEKIRSEVIWYIHLRNEGIISGSCGDFEKLLKFIDSLQEEPVSEDLEKAAEQDVCEVVNECSFTGIPNDHIPSWVQDAMINEFIHGAKWQKEHLWKSAEGSDLPIFDREVIAILDNGKVVFAHRPPEYWDGKNIITGKVTRNYPKTYGKGGWNIPNTKWWLDVELPKEIEL
jgi:hypothetical protein